MLNKINSHVTWGYHTNEETHVQHMLSGHKFQETNIVIHWEGPESILIS